MSPLALALVALGGALGGAARLWWQRLGPYRGTLAANTLACALLGLCHGLNLSQPWMLLAATGVAGAMSTWSTLAKELGGLLRDGHHGQWLRYLLLTIGCGALAMWLGAAGAALLG